MRRRADPRAARVWHVTDNTHGGPYAGERLEWRNGTFWLFEYAQVPGKWMACQGTGWSMFCTARAPGRLRRRKISACEAVKWLLIGDYPLADESGRRRKGRLEEREHRQRLCGYSKHEGLRVSVA